jgi:hypothetical protein
LMLSPCASTTACREAGPECRPCCQLQGSESSQQSKISLQADRSKSTSDVSVAEDLLLRRVSLPPSHAAPTCPPVLVPVCLSQSGLSGIVDCFISHVCADHNHRLQAASSEALQPALPAVDQGPRLASAARGMAT